MHIDDLEEEEGPGIVTKEDKPEKKDSRKELITTHSAMQEGGELQVNKRGSIKLAPL
jgi:3-dehydroquinate dehydratase